MKLCVCSQLIKNLTHTTCWLSRASSDMTVLSAFHTHAVGLGCNSVQHTLFNIISIMSAFCSMTMKSLHGDMLIKAVSTLGTLSLLRFTR